MRNSRADVITAALAVLQEHGFEHCSMRRVASHLGVQPSALYHHVPDKQTMLQLMADQIVAQGTASSLPLGSNPADRCQELRSAMLMIRDGAELVAAATAFRLGANSQALIRSQGVTVEENAILANQHTVTLVQEALKADLLAQGQPSAHTAEFETLEFETFAVQQAVSDCARTLMMFTFAHTQSTQTQLQAQEFLALASGRPAEAAAELPVQSKAALHDEFLRGITLILAGWNAQCSAMRLIPQAVV